jgi:hypothetical protein
MSTFAGKVALDLFRRDGIGPIWHRNVAAGHADQLGLSETAKQPLKTADIAKAFCFRLAESRAGMMAAHSDRRSRLP